MKKLASCIEGCERVEEIEPKKRYMAIVEAKVGPFKTSFAVELEVLEVDELHIKAKAEGMIQRLRRA